MASKGTVQSHILTATFLIICGYVATLPLYSIFPIRGATKESLGYPKDSLLNFTELTSKYGYLTEEHSVVTEDGYILQLFRIVKAKNCHGKKKKPPVILMHGLLQSSDSWLDAGPQAGLAYLISDACYDLWVGNVRGNYYSRRHVAMDPDKDPQFWRFSVDEIGLYDVPATIDYVLDYTGTKKVNYIGFSQGSGTFFIMCSERPGYCDKVKLLISLAPAARQTNTRSVPYRIVATSIYIMEAFLSQTGLQELFSKGALSQEFLAFFCQYTDFTEKMCDSARAIFDSDHPGSISNVTNRVLFGHFPAGTSVHNMARYGQSMVSEKFEKFDYGKNVNRKLYGSEYPPEYNLSAVTVPVMILYGRNDRLVDTKDVEWLIDRLPNVVYSKEVTDPLWTHLDVTYSQFTSQLLFPKINEYLSKFGSN